MIYTCKYKSPLGEILLAADEIGLTGLWFEGQKYFANTLPDERISQETEILSEAKNGWISISPVKSQHLHLLFILRDQHSDKLCGRFYQRFLTDKRSHMEKLSVK